MARESLVDFFEDFARLDESFIVHDDGYRVREASYRDIGRAARACAARLVADGFAPDGKIVIWSENRVEWVVAFWGCLIARAVVVPVDYRASDDLVRRVAAIVDARVVLVGREVGRLDGVEAPVRDIGDFVAAADAADETETGRFVRPDGSTLAEIIFTSGATADPKGVTITHRNVLANIVPIEREIRKYRRYERPFHPIRFLNLLPLSHMFGQSMATFVPPMLGGTVVFSHGYSPAEILFQIRSRRISVLVCVPKVLDVMRAHVVRAAPHTAEADGLAGRHWLWRWWRYRDVHRMFGWKFWCIVCGAAPLDPDLEAFWRKLGFLVVQGYGLTETAPIVTLNHPMHASRGTVGKPIAGVEVRIAADGEILVRGDNVTHGYYRPESARSDTAGVVPDEPFEDGWFHTGDVGELDAEGRLIIKGRKKEMIVTAQGLNVFPEDVERALLAEPGVRDAGVVGIRHDGEERVHAVLLVDPGTDVAGIVRSANARLEDHQRVWRTSIWPGEALPRTEGTRKLKRRELQRWASGESAAAPRTAGGTTVEEVVARFASDRDLRPETTIAELGLSSLDRVEMMMALESAFHTTLDERQIAAAVTLADLAALVAPGTDAPVPGRPVGTGEAYVRPAPGSPPPRAESIPFPSWNRSGVSRLVRRVSLATWILPLARCFLDLRVCGVEHLDDLPGPVIFAANHQSHLDTPAILLALPRRWRYRLAPAMAKEFFAAHFHPDTVHRRQWFTNSLNYYLACQFFNAFPLPQREAGTRETLRYIGDITGSGDSILIFPEGRRMPGDIAPFRAGVGMMAARLDLPVVPVRLDGLERILSPKMKWPVRGPARVTFGPPLRLRGTDYAALAGEVEQAVRALVPAP